MACYPWSVLDLYVGEINILSISNFILLLIIYDPHATQKASVGMYSGCDYLLSLKILFVCFFGIAIPTSSFNFIQLFLHLFLFFFYCMSATIYINFREVQKFARARKSSSHAPR